MSRVPRTWITPLATASFLVVGVTGTLMSFHLGERAVKGMHEWFGVAMVVASLLHIWKNWSSIQVYWKRGPHLQISAALAVLGVGGFLAAATMGGEGGPPGGMRAVMASVENAPLSSLGPVLDLAPEEMVVRLTAAGFEGVELAASPAQIGEATGRQGRDVVEALVR